MTDWRDIPCKIWTKGKSEGYGRIGAKGGWSYAHRDACIQRHGPPPSPQHMALHRCNNRACYEGEHLYWGTKRDNAEDSRRDGTMAQGEKHGLAKLNVQAVLLIRAIKLSSYSLAPIADISASAIRAVRNPKGRWKCLPIS